LCSTENAINLTSLFVSLRTLEHVWISLHIW
jgi:hypothetical protein